MGARGFGDDLGRAVRLGRWIWGLAAPIFLLGAWTTTVQLSLNALEKRQALQETELSEWRQWRESVNEKITGTRNDTLWIRQTLEELKRRDSR